ncbi:MAG: formate dehydrogenase subunit delta [Sphingomonadaceae bacterium]|nr:formate dehydrogenase subunit delta [Sphingomonadaceae bacterium]
MANQIAANFAVMGVEKAALATADHIATFWDPRMKQRIMLALHVDAPAGSPLNEIARRAVERLIELGAPLPQVQATTFGGVDEPGLSDAG